LGPGRESEVTRGMGVHTIWKDRAKRRFLWRAAFYVGAGGLSRATSLILLPLLLATLSTEDFSRYGLFVSFIYLSMPIVSLNIHVAPGRLFFDYDNVEQQQQLLFTSLVCSVSLTIAGILVSIAALMALHVSDPISQGNLGIRGLISLTIIVMIVVDFGRTLLRIKGNGVLYLVVSLLQSVGLIGTYFLITVFRFVTLFDGLLIAYLFSNGSTALVVLGYWLRNFKASRINYSMLSKAIRFSLPTSVHLVAMWAINMSGRWIGLLYLTLAELAPYILITQMYSAVAMLSRAVFESLLPEYHSAFGAQNYRRGAQILRVAMLASVALVLVIYGTLYIVLYVLRVELPAGYNPSPTMVLVAALISVLDAVYLQGIQLLQAMKKTHLQAITTVISGSAAIIVSVALVRGFGETGLLTATAIAWVFQAGLSNLVAYRKLDQRTRMPELAPSMDGSRASGV
jgi:O-antigen/teichoic acid export membrane protein